MSGNYPGNTANLASNLAVCASQVYVIDKVRGLLCMPCIACWQMLTCGWRRCGRSTRRGVPQHLVESGTRLQC